MSRLPKDQAPLIVLGAGAGGMIAAGRAAELGAEVLLLEKTERPGKKILISGKSRCNLTNAKDLPDFVVMYGANGRFLYPAFRRFFRDELLEFLHGLGLNTQEERGGRIFPASGRAADVVDALTACLRNRGVRLTTRCSGTEILTRNGRVCGVSTARGVFGCRAVIVATGGASYPETGSSGDGYRMAESLGHRLVKLRPALVPLVVEEVDLARSMQDVDLRNVRLTVFSCRAEEIDPALTPASDCGRGTGGRRPRPPVIESRFGEMTMTHFGIAGPITLLASLSAVDALAWGPVSVSIDLKPALSTKMLVARLQRDFDRSGRDDYRTILAGLLPQKMVGPFAGLTGLPPGKRAAEINAGRREAVARQLKSLRFNIRGPLPLSSAIVTAGGVSLDEVDPRTLASRKIDGLYFCGEVLDIDADTGGYNLQAAFSTGVLAGESAAAYAAGLPGPADRGS